MSDSRTKGSNFDLKIRVDNSFINFLKPNSGILISGLIIEKYAVTLIAQILKISKNGDVPANANLFWSNEILSIS